jgi:hypothetical protein
MGVLKTLSETLRKTVECKNDRRTHKRIGTRTRMKGIKEKASVALKKREETELKTDIKLECEGRVAGNEVEVEERK